MPVWRERRLEPRPFSLRLFLAKVGQGWQVMPGGFVRIADGDDARAVSLQRGARTADAWVLSDRPVAETTLLPSPERIVIKRASGVLPSRAADNLFWVGRYVERAEATLRLVRALINRTTEALDTLADAGGEQGTIAVGCPFCRTMLTDGLTQAQGQGAGENVQVALVACGVKPPEARRRTVESLEWVGLSEQADQLVEELSGGQQQRTALARGLALRGSVLLADEVTSELDAQNRQRVLDLLRAEADRGAAVVFATHDPEAAAACDAEVHLLDGLAEFVR